MPLRPPRVRPRALTVLIADDHAVVLDGLCALFERRAFRIVGEAKDGREAVRLARLTQPDLAVLDVVMPGVGGIEAAAEICRTSRYTRVILLTGFVHEHTVPAALAAGVRGLVVKAGAAQELFQAIDVVLRGGLYASAAFSLTPARACTAPTAPSLLTAREVQVLRHIVEGHSTKQIAALLDVSFKTAEGHRSSLMHKLGIHETASLVRYAIRRGLVTP